MVNLKKLARGLGGPFRLLTVAVTLAVVSVLTLALVPCVAPLADVVVGPECRHPTQQWRWRAAHSFWMDQIRVDPVATEVYLVPGRITVSVNSDFSSLGGRAKLARLPVCEVAAWTTTRHSTERPLIPTTRKPSLYWREEGYGLPFRWLTTTWHQSALRPYFVNENGVVARGVRGVPGPAGAGGNVVPTRIYWPHFLADVGLHAAGWLPALLLVWLGRAAVRRLRGRCPRCAYNLRGNPAQGCPECGWRRT